MKLFIATTPYNLFNYINLKVNLFVDDDVDLIISDLDDKNKKYYEEIKNLKIFNNVYHIKQRVFNNVDFIKSKIKRTIKKFVSEIKNRYFYNSYFKKYCKDMEFKKVYDEIYVDAYGFMQRFVFSHYHKNNKDLKVFKVDCGVESYYDMVEMGKATRKYKFIISKINKNLQGYYLYNEKIANVGKHKVFLIPKIEMDNKNFIDLVNKIFNYKERKLVKGEKEILFLDQILNDIELADNIEQKVVDILNQEIQNQFYVKLHPRTDVDSVRYKNIEKIKTENTFELFCLNNSWITNLKFITLFSTSSILPKLLFNEEPEVVCLTYLLNKTYPGSELVTEFFERVKSSYKDKNKFLLPKTIEEFISIIREMKKK